MKTALLILVLAATLPMTGCRRDHPTTSVATQAKASRKAALASYDVIYTSLTEDQTAGIVREAKALAGEARRAAKGAKGAAKTHLEGLAEASEQLASGANDLATARKDFGEVSRHVVGLLVAVPELQKNRHVFECPMAPGYPKWVQTDPAKKNPYMGKKNPSCGKVSDWKV